MYSRELINNCLCRVTSLSGVSIVSAVFALVIVVPALSIGFAVWWMYISPAYRPTNESEGLDVPPAGKVLLGIVLVSLLIFGVGGSGLW
jgi:hypothetical protein